MKIEKISLQLPSGNKTILFHSLLLLVYSSFKNGHHLCTEYTKFGPGGLDRLVEDVNGDREDHAVGWKVGERDGRQNAAH